MFVNHRNLFHVLIIGRILRSVFRIHNGLYREFYIIGGEFLTVMPLYILLQVECISTVCLIKLPAAGQSGNHFVVAVVSRKTVEEQHIDLPMLIHSGIDPGIIAAAVD
jgi:hypothetical protein